jgi:glycosyltransferase involved in cell wall biosynthesis
VTEPPSKPLVIGGWLADREGVGYYRMRLPLDELERRGHAVEYHAVLPWQRGKRPANHILVGQRVSNAATSAQWLAGAGDVRRVFELDDDLLNVDPASLASRRYYDDRGVRERLLANIRSADAITVSTDYLANVVRTEYGVDAPIHVLPNCLDPAVFDLEPVDHAGPVTIGWAGSDTHRGDFEHARKPLKRWFARNPAVGFQTMGVPYGWLVGRPGREKLWTPVWDGPNAYMRELDWQIGLAPLANNQFNRCKSPLKALEYAARGIVVVASDVEPYRGFVRHGQTGFLVQRDHEWAQYLDALVTDTDLRARMAGAAREQAREWTIEQHIDLWEKAYRG